MNEVTQTNYRIEVKMPEIECDECVIRVRLRNNKMKLIPKIIEGPFAAKKVVENRPVLLGNKERNK